MSGDAWAVGDAYEAYVGRWSRPVAATFLRWLGVARGRQWLDVGCGTGALTAAVLSEAEPDRVVGLDTSEGFLAAARARIDDARAVFGTADAQSLPLAAGSFDAAASALTLNFVPDPGRAVAELARVTRPDGVVAAYFWDYAGGMAMIRSFWDAATTLDVAAATLDEGRRFPLCRPDQLHAMWAEAGLDRVMVRSIETATVFADFDDYWTPFLGGQGPAPGYVMSLTGEHRLALRELLRARLATEPDGSIRLTARAWAVRGVVRR